MQGQTLRTPRYLALSLAVAFAGLTLSSGPYTGLGHAADAPTPLLEQGKSVDWWFMFKFNSQAFPECGGTAKRVCAFGGEVQDYKKYSQQFVYASKDSPALQQGSGCAGDSVRDPLGATFGQVYNGAFFYLIWNDQFYDDPEIEGCTKSCGSPWGHSKGMLAWDDTGAGLVLQVTTPSWPASGSKKAPRTSDGNTLGCVEDDNVEVSQHFFSLKLNKDDVIKVLNGLENASVVTDIKSRQVVNNGGPADIQALVHSLGTKSKSKKATREKLSSGVELISKPSHLNVPPWQLVSSVLDGVSLRTATWWTKPKIYSTKASTPVECWGDTTLRKPGAVEIALTGKWKDTEFGLAGGPGPNFNHAKIGVSTAGEPLAIFGDMNQQGSLSGPKCESSQNGRGGLFYVVKDAALHDSVQALIKGTTAPVNAPEQ
jgi:hypothetical protein